MDTRTRDCLSPSSRGLESSFLIPSERFSIATTLRGSICHPSRGNRWKLLGRGTWRNVWERLWGFERFPIRDSSGDSSDSGGWYAARIQDELAGYARACVRAYTHARGTAVYTVAYTFAVTARRNRARAGMNNP